ncbi:hypothetical protein LMG667_03365 [Xanthomonas euvesicatoria]|nr:hypothetical protein LMG667_03365 [Xanthomonas euvesicatoria]
MKRFLTSSGFKPMSANQNVVRLTTPTAILLKAALKSAPQQPTLHEIRKRGWEAAERLRDMPRPR